MIVVHSLKTLWIYYAESIENPTKNQQKYLSRCGVVGVVQISCVGDRNIGCKDYTSATVPSLDFNVFSEPLLCHTQFYDSRGCPVADLPLACLVLDEAIF